MAKVFVAARALVFVLAMVAAPVTAWGAAPPLDVYGNLPDIERMALSESGDRLAAIMTVGGHRALIVMTAALDPLRAIPLTDEKVRQLQWVGDDELLAVVSQTNKLSPEYVQSKFEFFHPIIVPATDSNERHVVFDGDPKMINAEFGEYGVRKVDGKWMAYFAGIEKEKGAHDYYLGRASPALYAVDVAGDSWHRIAHSAPEGQNQNWLLGEDGQVAATMTFGLIDGRWSIYAPGGRAVANGEAPRGEVGLVALGKDGTTAIYSERKEDDDVTRLLEVPLDGSRAAQELMKAEDTNGLYTDRTTGRLIGFRPPGSRQVPKFFDPAIQAKVNKIYAAFPGLELDVIDWTTDFSKVLVRTSGNADSGTWYLVDTVGMHANAVGYERVAIEPDQVGKISTVNYKAGDGTQLDGVLTLPPGREAKNLALVVLPHGGPHASDVEAFDWWAQAFASRGYAVFQPNFRGSTNRDEAFRRASFGQWGRKMQTDLSDGVAELARESIIDPTRVCIMGGSYGGYAALAGVTLQHGIYRCAVAVAGVSDLHMLYNDELTKNGRSRFEKMDLSEEFGAPDTLDEVSPRKAAAQADAPVLLIHGRDDTVVQFKHSEEMKEALESAHKPVELVELKAEDHWLSRAATRKQMLEAAMEFMLKNNPPG